MRSAYEDRGLSLRQLAAEAECGVRTIARWMQTHGIVTRSDARPRPRLGADHPNWSGGLPICGVCGERTSSYDTTTHRRCRDISGPNGPNWRGSDIGYTGAHYRVTAARGLPGQHACAHCSEVAQEWAYDHEDPDERRNVDSRDDDPFSLDVMHYLPLCKKCHRAFDLNPNRAWR